MFLKRNNVIFSLIVMVVSGLAYWESLSFRTRSARWPRTVIIATLIFCSILLIKEYLKYRREEKSEVQGAFSNLNWQIMFVIIFTIVYVYLIPRLGFFACTFLYLNVAMFILGLRRKKMYIAPPIIVLFIYLIFKTVLNLPLPEGIFI